MKRNSFLSPDGAILTCMVQAEEPKRIEELMELSRPLGAEAFGMQFCRIKPEFRTRETYERLFELAAPLPVYVTNYRHLENKVPPVVMIWCSVRTSHACAVFLNNYR